MSAVPTIEPRADVVRIDVTTTREHATKVLTEAVAVLDQLAVTATNQHAETLKKIHQAHTEAWALLESFTTPGETKHED